MLMALGFFRFALDTQAITGLTDREDVRLAAMPRGGSMPTLQFLGPGERQVVLRAVIYKEVLSPRGPTQIELMRLAMRRGTRLPLIARSGHFYGFFLIEALEVEKTHALPNGTFAKMETTITLNRQPRNFAVAGIPLF
ncbi:MAG: phage tail protein [Paracoccaceae bacterium]